MFLLYVWFPCVTQCTSPLLPGVPSASWAPLVGVQSCLRDCSIPFLVRFWTSFVWSAPSSFYSFLQRSSSHVGKAENILHLVHLHSEVQAPLPSCTLCVRKPLRNDMISCFIFSFMWCLLHFCFVPEPAMLRSAHVPVMMLDVCWKQDAAENRSAKKEGVWCTQISTPPPVLACSSLRSSSVVAVSLACSNTSIRSVVFRTFAVERVSQKFHHLGVFSVLVWELPQRSWKVRIRVVLVQCRGGLSAFDNQSMCACLPCLGGIVSWAIALQLRRTTVPMLTLRWRSAKVSEWDGAQRCLRAAAADSLLAFINVFSMVYAARASWQRSAWFKLFHRSNTEITICECQIGGTA